MKKIKKRMLNLILTAALSLTAVFAAAAQSTDPAKPTVLVAGEFAGTGPSAETSYYFAFTGGEGEVAVGLEIKAKQYSTFARLELLDAGMNLLAAHNMNAATSTGAARAQKKIALGEKRTVLLKLTLDANLAAYKITLGGALESAAVSSAATENVTNQTKQTGGEQIFDVDLRRYKLGQFINLPKSGTLIVELKDGTTQEISLRDVKNLTIRP